MNGVLFGVIVIAVILVWGRTIYTICSRKQMSNSDRELIVTFAVLAMMIAFYAVLEHLTVGVKPHGAIFSGGQVVAINMSGYACDIYWKSMIPRGWEAVDIAPWQRSVTMHLNPITTNPKVRNLIYKVEISGGATLQECVSLHLWQKRNGRSADDWLRYQLYELNEAKSREMSQFYNPCDTSQQAEFRKLVEDWLPPIPPGVNIVSISFRLL